MLKLKVLNNLEDTYNNFFDSVDFINYHSKRKGLGIISVGVYDAESESQITHISLTGSDGVWRTPVTGAYGGIKNDAKISTKAIEFLIKNLPDFLQSITDVTSISIKLPPGDFLNQSTLISSLLSKSGWTIQSIDINYHLSISSVEYFMKNLNKSKRKLLRRLEKDNFQFRSFGVSNISEIYNVIKKNRCSQKIPMTMSQPAIISLIEKFPNDILLFGVLQSEVLVASSICIRINSNCLYVFYWGELPEYRKASPVSLLAKGLVSHCIKSDFAYLDLGTCSTNENVNLGLAQLKSSLGGTISPKFTFLWSKVKR